MIPVVLPLQGRTILVIDDDADTVESLAIWLEARGAFALRGRSAAEAWALLGTIAVDALVTDVVMPGESGLELAARLRSDPRFARLPIIAFSGVVLEISRFAAAAPAGRAAVAASSVDAFHPKPLHPAVIELELRGLIERASA